MAGRFACPRNSLGELRSARAEVYTRGVFQKILNHAEPEDSLETLIRAFFYDLGHRPPADASRIFHEAVLSVELPPAAAVSRSHFALEPTPPARRLRALLMEAMEHQPHWLLPQHVERFVQALPASAAMNRDTAEFTAAALDQIAARMPDLMEPARDFVDALLRSFQERPLLKHTPDSARRIFPDLYRWAEESTR